MTDAERRSGRGDKDHERCPCCDPGLLDDLKCKAKGIEAQAKYNADNQQKLDDARTAFEAARAAYSKARGEAEPEVAAARRELEELRDRIRCQLDHEELECLDRAFGRVVERLDRCGHERGCCCDEDCDYDDDVRDCDPDDVPGRLAVIKYRTKEAADCFWDLIGEHTVVPEPAPAPSPAPSPAPAAAAAPASAAGAAAAPAAGATDSSPPADAALPARVKALQAEIEAISQATGDGSWKPSKLYAALLVARRHLHNVWRGFANVNEYMECLCRALTCLIEGHAAIGELTRQAAVNQCHRDCWKAGCKYLAENTVAEVLAEYLRVCAEDDECEPDRDREEDRDRHRDRHRDRDRDRRRDRHDRDDDRDRDRDRDDDRDRDRDDDRDRDRDRDDDRDRDRDDDRDRDRDSDDRDDGHERAEGERGRKRSRPYRDARGRYSAP
jgi:hypothetical protein